MNRNYLFTFARRHRLLRGKDQEERALIWAHNGVRSMTLNRAAGLVAAATWLLKKSGRKKTKPTCGAWFFVDGDKTSPAQN